MFRSPKSITFLWLLVSCCHSLNASESPSTGVPVAYQLPTDGPLPRTYLVTLAIVEKSNPDWIISQFACGMARTVTKENGRKFSEIWDGLDDNFMPVPPGDYAVKGIYSSARQWQVDGEWHAITPKFAGGASPWLPSPDDWKAPEPFGGDPVGAPMKDVAVGANGIAVFYYQYLENGLNLPMIDLKQPLGPAQFIKAFNSGGAGGGPCVTTDGESAWAFSEDGGPKFVYRADGKSFGVSHGANRSNAYLPKGWVKAMACWRDQATQKTYVYVAQRGKIVEEAGANGHRSYSESTSEFINQLTVHDGTDGKILTEIPLPHAQGLAVRDNVLYALQAENGGFVVTKAALANGIPEKWSKVFSVPAKIHPSDLEVGGRETFYLSDPAANHVYQLNAGGKITRTFGRLDTQKPGTYDPETLMMPEKLAVWTDESNEDHLIIVEQAGPNRVSEWSAQGKLIREFMSLQTHANDGYGFDPEHPNHIYLPGKQGWMTRFNVNYETREWKVDAVWPMEENDPRAGRLDRLKFIRVNGRAYLAGRRSFTIYRFDGDKLVLSAGILQLRPDLKKPPTYAFWHDTNGNGHVNDDELTPTQPPGLIHTYHGQNWTEDLALLAPAQNGQDVWRVAPSSFDSHGNPVFTTWTKLLTDPIFTARTAGNSDAVHGGNELAEKFTSDWLGADGTPETGFYVQARGGKNFSANEAPQHKITRYIPDGKGGYSMKWRTGRSSLQTLAKPGEIYGAMRIQRPINGLLSVIDQSRCGVLLYTDGGLYVDTVFPDGRRINGKNAGLYPQPGEFFAGEMVPNRDNGKIYAAMGKYTPLLFEIEGWSLKQNPVQALTTLPKSITISAAQIASPPEMALSLRGGAGTAKLAHFAPGLGEPSFDGSINGWESCEPVVFNVEKEKDQQVEVRCLYQPEQLLLRWHVRLGSAFQARPMPPPERIFTHDQLADTLSFYIQSDAAAKPGGDPAGRPGDTRFVFGIFKDAAGNLKPIAVGMHVEWTGAKDKPQTYRTPVGAASFAHVGEVAGAQLTHRLDDDRKGFVFVASIPRSALPRLKSSFAGGFRTLVNFEATLGGHGKSWWANSDGSASRETFDEPTEARLYHGSWAPAEFLGLKEGVVVRHWQLAGPFGGPGAEKFKADPNGVISGTTIDMKKAVREFCETTTFPPDGSKIDLKQIFEGPQTQGYWPNPGRVTWKTTTIESLDTRIKCGGGGQVWFGATWVFTPNEVELTAHLQSHPMTELRWTVNGRALEVKSTAYEKGKNEIDRVARSKFLLQKGWNEFRFRGYCYGYPPFRVGLVLDGPEPALWPLKLSSQPPTLLPDTEQKK